MSAHKDFSEHRVLVTELGTFLHVLQAVMETTVFADLLKLVQ